MVLATFVSTLHAAPATAPHREPPVAGQHEAGTPERVYLELIRAIRAGEFEKGMKLLQPPPPRFTAFVLARMKMHHSSEKLTSAMRKRFGDEVVEQAGATFLPEKSLAAVRAKINGDVAVLSFVPLFDSEYATSAIKLHRVEGKWLVGWQNCLSPWAADDDDFDEMTDEHIQQFVNAEPLILKLHAGILARIEAGEFASPEDVQRAMVDASFPDR